MTQEILRLQNYYSVTCEDVELLIVVHTRECVSSLKIKLVF